MTHLIALALSLTPLTAVPTPAQHVQAQTAIERPYFPPTEPGDDSWQRLDPASEGWDTAALAELDDFLAANGTRGFAVLQGGRLLVESYFGGWSVHSTQPIFSVTKSLTATQLGVLQTAGLLDLDDPVSAYLGLGWSNAPPLQELAISIREVAAMSSGLDASFARVAAPGTVWFYNTPVYRELIDVVESASGLSRSQFADLALWTPIGMHDTSYAANGEFMTSSTRDLARFGLLIARGGTWQATQVAGDPAFLEEMRTQSQTLNPSYGLLWWINGQSAWIAPNGTSGRGSFVPSAPDDMTMALGASDQKVYVVPSRDWVVVRQGAAAAGRVGAFDDALWTRLLAAAP